MVASTCLLVLACAVAINAQALYCTDVYFGNRNGDQQALDKVILQPGIANWNVKIPAIPQCPNGLSGAKAHVCDSDSKPTAQFTDVNNLTVHRSGQLLGYGTVNVIVYCNDFYSPQQSQLDLLSGGSSLLGGQNQLPSQAKTLLLNPY